MADAAWAVTGGLARSYSCSPWLAARTDRKIPQRCHASVDGQDDQVGKDCVASLGSTAPGPLTLFAPPAVTDPAAQDGCGASQGQNSARDRMA
jgi:hypothetical protein